MTALMVKIIASAAMIAITAVTSCLIAWLSLEVYKQMKKDIREEVKEEVGLEFELELELEQELGIKEEECVKEVFEPFGKRWQILDIREN